MTTELEVLEAPEQAEEEIRSVAGEVVDPEDLLKKHEQNIRKNLKKFETVQQSVARSLNVIYHNSLWKIHKTADGKRRYTNFNDYLSEEFGWDKSAARARQIMKQDLPLAIEAGDVPEEVGDKRRDRAAPLIDAVKAAKVTKKQLQTVRDAWATRMENVESGEAFSELNILTDNALDRIDEILDELDSFVETQEAQAETADDEEQDDEETAEE